jgi:PIN domain nuclease of toxin-antitoxin system
VIVLDTHVVLWLAEAPELLSKKASAAILKERQSGSLSISDMTLLELARLISAGRISVRTSVADFLASLERNFTILPITGSIAERATTFSTAYPRDPVDRVVGATALIHGTRLITKDEKIRASGEVNCVW